MNNLEMIFNRQTELMHKYEAIVVSNGVHINHNLPNDIQSHQSQAFLRRTAHQFIEEIGEAYEALKHDDVEAVQEELADAFHFLIEWCILSGITPAMLEELPREELAVGDPLDSLYAEAITVVPQSGSSEKAFFEPVQRALMACFLLKNKPWKQTRKDTNPAEYTRKVFNVLLSFLALCAQCHMSPDDLHYSYFTKSEENKRRQDTGY